MGAGKQLAHQVPAPARAAAAAGERAARGASPLILGRALAEAACRSSAQWCSPQPQMAAHGYASSSQSRLLAADAGLGACAARVREVPLGRVGVSLAEPASLCPLWRGAATRRGS